GGAQIDRLGKLDPRRNFLIALGKLSGDDRIELRVSGQTLLEGRAPVVVNLDLAAVSGADRKLGDRPKENSRVPAPTMVVLQLAVQLDVGHVHGRVGEGVDRGLVLFELDLGESVVGPDRYG